MRRILSLSAMLALASSPAFAQSDDKPKPVARPPAKGGVTPSAKASEGTPVLSGDTGDADFDCKEVKSNTKVQPNFENADIKEVIEWISTTTCKRFIISEKVKGGRITIMSPVAVSATEAYRAFEAALAANGLAVVQEGKYLKLVEAKEKGANFRISASELPAGENIATQMFFVQNGDANEVAKILEKFKSDAGDITVYPATNLLIVTDWGSTIRRLSKILEEIDKPGLGEQVYVVDVKYSKAADMAQLLQEVFKPAAGGSSTPAGGKTTSGKRTPTKGEEKLTGDVAPATSGLSETSPLAADATVSKIIPDERTNQLIIVSSKASYEKVLYLMSKLDVVVPGSDSIHVIRLQNADAPELATVLSSLSKGGNGASPAGRPARGDRANPGNPSPAAVSSGVGEAGAVFTGEVKVNADESTNSLVVVASKGDFEVIQRVVTMLDIPRRQVYLEAMIFEVSLTKNRNSGVVFHGGVPVGDPPNGLIFGGSQDAGLSSLTPSLLPQFTLGAIGGEPINIGGVTIPPVGVLLNLVALDSEANVLSTPTLLATDNEEATITVGQNIPVPVGNGLGNLLGSGGNANAGLGALAGLGGFASLGQQITRQNVGVTFAVTPQINEGDYVTLQMTQEITAVQSIDSNGPTLSNRNAQTTVTVKDQQTVVIGGLMEERVTTTVKKVPVLGDIPLLGYLFRNQSKVKTKTNLIIVVTPYIIKDQSDLRRILERKMEERRLFIEQFTSGGDSELTFDIDYRRKKGALDQVLTAMDTAEKEEFAKAALRPKDEIILPQGVPATPEPGIEKLEGGSGGGNPDEAPLDSTSTGPGTK
jgi:general secretion pathway protein D